MPTIIKAFQDGSHLEYDTGRFDDWCIYQTPPRTAPRDIEYFSRLQELSQIYGNERIYADFIKVYDRTKATLDPEILQNITEFASQYTHHRLEMDKLFTIVYAGMVAEENKANTILKKRIKRLGIYQVLIEGLSPQEAANFSRGKKASIIDKECRQRGF